MLVILQNKCIKAANRDLYTTKFAKDKQDKPDITIQEIDLFEDCEQHVTEDIGTGPMWGVGSTHSKQINNLYNKIKNDSKGGRIIHGAFHNSTSGSDDTSVKLKEYQTYLTTTPHGNPIIKNLSTRLNILKLIKLPHDHTPLSINQVHNVIQNPEKYPNDYLTTLIQELDDIKTFLVKNWA